MTGVQTCALPIWKKSEEEVNKLQKGVEQSPASIIITNINGTIEYVNPKFCEVTGYSREEVVGHNPRILKSGDKKSADYKLMWETLNAGNEWRGEFYNVKKNGDKYWESASISPIRDRNGKTTHFVAVKEDITQMKLAKDKQQTQKNELEQMNKLMIGRELKMAELKKEIEALKKN